MLLKTIFLLIILWFILVAVGNMIRAIRVDTANARRSRPPDPPKPRAEWVPPKPPPPEPERVRTATYGPYRYGEPAKRRPSRAEDVEDARFRDV